MLRWLKRKLAPAAIEDRTSEELMAVCDRFWAPGTGDHAEFVFAYNALATRGPEIREWCRRLLSHPDYLARESGSFLLGQLGSRGQLGDAVHAIIDELGALTRRPIEEDGKELQANDAAIRALAAIGLPEGVPHLRAVLFSNDEFLSGDTQWNAAESLSELVGESFMKAADPISAAREWLRANPA